MTRVGVITVARSDYGIYTSLLRALSEDPDFDLYLIAAGMHLSADYGMTVDEIKDDGYEIKNKVEMNLISDSPAGISKSMGLGTIGFSEAYENANLDLLIVLGDRFEMHAAAVAAVPFNIPLIHIHGGELSEGAIDDSFRHSITKLSHLHFVSTETYRNRVIQMGEEPWRVTASGALALDGLDSIAYLDREALSAELGMKADLPVFLITYHPVTLEMEETESQIQELLDALKDTKANLLFTYPNADTNNRIIIEKILDFVDQHESAQLVPNLGRLRYFSLMKIAKVMIGNSSSGIIEAGSFRLPVVNIGNRQKGRIKGKNVIDVVCSSREIQAAIDQATSIKFNETLSDLVNPYGDGLAAERIIKKIKKELQRKDLIVKHFFDLEG